MVQIVFNNLFMGKIQSDSLLVCKPLYNNNFLPHITLIPLLAFDNNNHRLGYGKGYFDKFLNKYLKKNKHIVTIGVAFSFQKYNKLPVTKNDVKLDYILTNKGIKKK